MNNTAKIYHALANSNGTGRITIRDVNFPVDISNVRIETSSCGLESEIRFTCDVLHEYPRSEEARAFAKCTEAISHYNGALAGFIRTGYTYNQKNYANLNIEKVIFNDPATIVIWKDGTKTVVKASNEPFDPEKGLAMAIVKRAFGNQGNYFNIFKKWIPEDLKKASEPKTEPEPPKRWKIHLTHYDPDMEEFGHEIHPVDYSTKSSAIRRAKQLCGDNPMVKWRVVQS